MNVEELRNLINKHERELQDAKAQLTAIEKSATLTVASELHDLFCSEWCDHGRGAYPSSHFDPTCRGETSTSIDITKARIFRRYTEAADKLLKLGTGKDTLKIIRLLVELKKAKGD